MDHHAKVYPTAVQSKIINQKKQTPVYLIFGKYDRIIIPKFGEALYSKTWKNGAAWKSLMQVTRYCIRGMLM